MRSHGDGSVSVDRSGEERPHAYSQTISGAGSARCRMTMTSHPACLREWAEIKGLRLECRRLFWRPSDLSLTIGRICQIRDRGVLLQARR
jgi:hypothetical protein